MARSWARFIGSSPPARCAPRGNRQAKRPALPHPRASTAQAAHSEGPQQSASAEKEACPCGRDSGAKVHLRGPALVETAPCMPTRPAGQTACELTGRPMLSAGDSWALQPVMGYCGPMLACLTHASLRMSSMQASGWAGRHQWTQTCSSMFSSPCQDNISSARRPTNCASSLVAALLSMAAAMTVKARQKWRRSGLEARRVGLLHPGVRGEGIARLGPWAGVSGALSHCLRRALTLIRKKSHDRALTARGAD